MILVAFSNEKEGDCHGGVNHWERYLHVQLSPGGG